MEVVEWSRCPASSTERPQGEFNGTPAIQDIFLCCRDDEDVQETEEEGSVGSEERDQDDDDEPESTEGEVETAERVTAGTTSGYGTQNGSSFSPPKSKGSLVSALRRF